MRSIPQGQLTLSFEPALPERFNSLREFIAHRVQAQARNAKAIAADMDMAPSTLSRKLSAGIQPDDKDTARFNVDDLELYIARTKDVAPIEYLAAKFLQAPEGRQAAALERLESIISEATAALAAIRSGAKR